ncbi:MAG: glycosyltransferase [Pseudomonadales bacterium]|nr:glycosyltransferase [Pseudomonadales bacterium]
MKDSNNTQPLVSVVIASFNMGQYLCAAIDSILNQTWENLEIIIIDDGSTDDTEERMKLYMDDLKVKYIKTENRGQPKAKNRGIDESSGEYIAFCDADDLWEPFKLEVQLPAFEDDRVGVVYSDVSYIDGDGNSVDKEETYVFFSGHVTNRLVIKNFVPFGTAVIRSQCIKQSGRFDEDFRMGIDWDLWLRYSLHWEFKFVDKKTYIYRIWPGQMSSNYRGRYDHAFRIFSKFVENNPERITKSIIRKALSDMYINRAYQIIQAEEIYIEPLGDILQGLAYDPFSKNGWKILVKLFVISGIRYSASFYNIRKLSYNILNKLKLLDFMRLMSATHPRILMYHRIVDDETQSGISKKKFVEQLNKISKSFNVISMDDLFDAYMQGEVPRNSVVLTFDDGYEDFYRNAFPILKEFGMPASLYVPTDFVSGKSWLWPDCIRYILNETSKDSLKLEFLEAKELLTGDIDYAWDLIADYFVTLADNERDRCMILLAKVAEVELPERPVDAYKAASWLQIRELSENRISIGSHSVTHSCMSRLSLEDITREVEGSRREISKYLGVDVDAFCYPYGSPCDISETVRKAVANAGYRYALAAFPSVNPLQNIFEINRYAVSENDEQFDKNLYGLSYLKKIISTFKEHE